MDFEMMVKVCWIGETPGSSCKFCMLGVILIGVSTDVLELEICGHFCVRRVLFS